MTRLGTVLLLLALCSARGYAQAPDPLVQPIRPARPAQPALGYPFLDLSLDDDNFGPLRTNSDDSRGYTYGLQLDFGYITDQGERYTLAYNSYLYTDQAPIPLVDPPNAGTLPIYFRDIMMFRASYDSLVRSARAHRLYIRAGAGLGQINEQAPGGVFSAAAQQRAFHPLFNKLFPRYRVSYEYVPSGNKRLVAGLDGGIGKAWALGPRLARCNCDDDVVSAEVDMHYLSESDGSSVNAVAALNKALFNLSPTVRLVVEGAVDYAVHYADGVHTVRVTEGLAIHTTHWILDVRRYDERDSHRLKFTRFYDHDPIFTFGIGRRF